MSDIVFYCVFWISSITVKDISDVTRFGIKQNVDFYKTDIMASSTKYLMISLSPTQAQQDILIQWEKDGKGYCFGKRSKDGLIFSGRSLPVDIWKDWSIVEVSTP